MHGSRHPKYTPVEKVLIVLLCILCVASFIWFFFNVSLYSREGDLRTYRHRIESAQPRENIPVTSIKTWMTFDYLNVVFALNPSYLQSKLGITDTHYPNIRIDSYARHHNLDAQTLLQNIQQLITQHTM
jgi:hypothetical protein